MKTANRPSTPGKEEKTTQKGVKWQSHNQVGPKPFPALRWEEDEQWGGDWIPEILHTWPWISATGTQVHISLGSAN